VDDPGPVIEQTAKPYMVYSVDQLWAVMDQEWVAAAGFVGQRGVVKFTQNVLDRLAEQVRAQQVVVGGTAGVAVGQVLDWAQSEGLDLTLYRIPIAVAVALVVKSVLGDGGPPGPHSV
jgi:hypothetical protein